MYADWGFNKLLFLWYPVTENVNLWHPPGQVLLCPKMETEPATKMLCFFKQLDDRAVPKKKIVSVYFSCVRVTLLDFLPLEYRTDGLS